jgi:hypothetical protein
LTNVAQPDQCTQIKQMIGRDPGLRQPADHQQLAQQPGVRTVGLGALLAPAPLSSLSRLSQVRTGPDRVQLLDDEAPARRRLERHLELLATEPRKEPSHALAVRRHDPRPTELPGLSVDPLSRDLRPMLVKSHYDRHTGPPQAPRLNTCADLPRLS